MIGLCFPSLKHVHSILNHADHAYFKCVPHFWVCRFPWWTAFANFLGKGHNPIYTSVIALYCYNINVTDVVCAC